MNPPQILLIAGSLLLLSILSSKFSERFGVPALLMFLVVGMLAGSDGPGGLYFDNAALANAVGALALAYILFSGGLDTRWHGIRPVLSRGIILSTVGVAITTAALGLFIWLVLDFPPAGSFLIAATVSSTDAAAVFSVFRSRGVGLRGNLRPLLELESGSNDPMAIFLTIGFIEVLTVPDAAWTSLIAMFFIQMSVGLFIGLGAGRIAGPVINRIRLDYEGLYPVLTMAMVVVVFGLAEVLGGNGFLAVYLCGIVLGNREFVHKRSLVRFHDGLSWLVQIGLFLVLGLLVFPSQLPAVAGAGMLVSAFLMLVARPLAVYLALWRSSFDMRARTLVAWAGLRGAVPIVLATFPLMAGYPRSEEIFHIVFFVVLTSVLLQGKSLMTVARWLKVDAPAAAPPRYPLEFDRTDQMQGETREFDIPPDSPAVGKAIVDLGLPHDVLILLIRRGSAFVVPRGQTIIQPHDALLILAEAERLNELNRLLQPDAVGLSR